MGEYVNEAGELNEEMITGNVIVSEFIKEVLETGCDFAVGGIEEAIEDAGYSDTQSVSLLELIKLSEPDFRYHPEEFEGFIEHMVFAFQ